MRHTHPRFGRTVSKTVFEPILSLRAVDVLGQTVFFSVRRRSFAAAQDDNFNDSGAVLPFRALMMCNTSFRIGSRITVDHRRLTGGHLCSCSGGAMRVASIVRRWSASGLRADLRNDSCADLRSERCIDPRKKRPATGRALLGGMRQHDRVGKGAGERLLMSWLSPRRG